MSQTPQTAEFARFEATEVSAVPSDAELDQAWLGDVYGLSASGLEVGPQDLYTMSPEFEMVGAGRETDPQANYDFLRSSNSTEQMILDAGMASSLSVNQLGMLNLSVPGPMSEGGGFTDHFFGRLDNAWESIKSTGALIRDASGFGDEGSFTRTWTALGEASSSSNKFIGSVLAAQIPFNDLLLPEIAQYRRDVASGFVNSIADRYTLAYEQGGWSAVAGEGVGDVFVLGVEALAAKGAGRLATLAKADRLFKLDLDGPDNFNIRQTGARSGELGPHDWDAAETVYDVIRTQNDVPLISQNVGMPEFMIDRVKNHLFYKDDHLKWEGLVGRLDADPLIANAWNRLSQGAHTRMDMQLLRHEYLESRFESLFKTDLDTAHRRVSDRNPSGLE